LTTLKLLLFFILTGLLLGISFPHVGGFTFILFFALIPILIAENYVFQKRLRARKVFWFSYLGFFVFNLIVGWWLMNASFGAMVMAVCVNALYMAFFFWLFHLVHRRYGHYWGYTALVVLWLTYEYCQNFWEVSFTWANFGYAFASKHSWIQWYEYTGIGGGTLWVLLVNLIGYRAVNAIYFKQIPSKKLLPVLFTWLTLIALPLICSFVIYSNYTEKKDPIDVVVVQPNIDPYGDKFQNMTSEEQMTIFLREAFMVSDSTVDFIVGPETALPYSINERELLKSGEVELLQRVLSKMKTTELVIGMSSHNLYSAKENKPDNARIYPDGSGVEMYNSALFLGANNTYSIYHKSQLMLGVEKVPFVKIFPFLESLAMDMGGTVGSLGVEKGPKNFISKNNKAKIAPSICLESAYVEFMSGFVNAGANVIFIITNDGWWGNTPGYRQHFEYARVLAICLRRSIAQSANTGTSGFINQRGDVIQHSNWWEPCALRQNINLNNELTFYAIHGDLIYRLSAYFSIVFVLLYLYAYIFGKNFVSSKEV
jgi:apolipoprotein N-acyltransferase